MKIAIQPMLAPLMNNIAARIAMNTMAVPRSGCRNTRKVGIAISAPAPTMVDRRPMRSRRLARNDARTTIMRTLLTSLNWKSRPATVIDIWAPNRLVPSTSVSVSRASTAR